MSQPIPKSGEENMGMLKKARQPRKLIKKKRIELFMAILFAIKDNQNIF